MSANNRNRLKTTVSAVASSGLGAFTISTASSGYRSFVAGDDGLTFDGVLITEGTTWEVRDGCVYTHSGTSLSRGTLMDSSTGSAIAFTSAAVVSQGGTAGTATSLWHQLERGTVIIRNDGSTTLSIAASTFTKLSCINSEEYDPDGWWDNANQKFLPTRAGKYLIVAGSQITMAGGAGVVTSYLLVARKNGSDYAHLARGWISGSGNVGVSGSCIVDLNGSTDYVEPFAWQNDSVSRLTVAGAERQFFMATFLGAT